MTNLIVRKNNVGNRWLDPVLEDFFSVPSLFDRRTDTFVPRTNIVDSNEKLILSFEVPGMKKEDIKVTVSGNMISITGNRQPLMKSEKEQIVREEMLSGEFERQFTLPDSVNTDSIEANYKHGILTIELDKKEEVKPKEIDIQIK